ncbi:MAG: exodeoxyribonuclease V subunit gamma [Oscillospiraceae bacterium]|nr:exodeoxyribonuclease V subunit gamma [Oscillospiraceae bacterium]
MVYRIFGRSGYGKSEYLYNMMKERISERPDKEFDIFLIVPEQETAMTERKVAEKFGNASNLRIEALSFDIMSQRVSRKVGKIAYDYADSTVKKLVMHKTLKLLDPVLDFYGKVAGNMEFVEKMVETVDSMKLELVSPLMLETASAEINKSDSANSTEHNINEEISKKINEISLIYSVYEKNFGVNSDLYDISDEMTYLCSLLDTEYTDFSDGKDGKKKKFFSGTNVFFDSFDSFSNGQKAVLSRIFSQADNVYITHKYTPSRFSNFEEENIFAKIIETSDFISDLCRDKNIQSTDILLNAPQRFKNDILTYLEKNLWTNRRNANIPEYNFADKLEIYECSKIFDEAETAAKKILYLTREKGWRYSDIQIIVSDILSYKGILDAVFEKYTIPLFMSMRTQLSTKPLMSMLLSLFDMIIYDFRLQNIHGYIKNGLCGLTYKEIDDIELYITSWQINGLRRYNGTDWNMHPDGYVEYDETDENIKEILAGLNAARKKFILPVVHFMRKVSGLTDINANTVKNITSAVVDFLEELGTYGRLAELTKEQKENGEITEAAETVQIWNILMELLQKMVLVCGNELMDLKQYAELFRFIISDADIGKIPTAIDEVIVLKAGLMRSGGNKKCSFILGLNTDVFPAKIEDDDLFSDREKALLKSHKLDFSSDCLQKSYDQLYYFYTAATSASECVILTYRKADINGEAMLPSVAVDKIISMYPNVPVYTQDENFGNIFFTLESGENGFIEMCVNAGKDKILNAALKNYFSGNIDYKDKVDSKNIAFKETDLTVNRDIADKLFYNLNMSSTRLDTYVNCQFSYFCRYVLGLKTESSAKMQMNDIGRFIHKILEIFMLKVRDENIEFKSITDEFIKTESEKIIDEYLGGIIKDYEFKTERFRYLLRRLNKIIFEIIKNLRDEFQHCDFIPADFELTVTDKIRDNSINPVEINIPNRGKLKITGVIDRVDIYKEDDDVYVRIVDYKTGSKKFNLSDVLAGLNLQMFIYLFSVWHNGQGRYSEKSGNESGGNIPAGVLYMPSRSPQYEKKAKMSDSEISEEKSKSFTRSGLFLRDEKILNAMEHNLEGRYIPIKLKSDKNISFKKSTASGVLASLEQIGKLERYVTSSLSEIACELSNGKANVKPFKGKLDSCAFCDMRKICRFEENDLNKKSMLSFAPDKVWEIMDSINSINDINNMNNR